MSDDDEPSPRERLRALGRTLSGTLAVLLVWKGCWMGLGPESYRELLASTGLAALPETLHYLASAFATLAGLAYAVAWLLGRLENPAERRMNRVAFGVLMAGLVITQLAGTGSIARGLALVVILAALPILQLVVSGLAGPESGA